MREFNLNGAKRTEAGKKAAKNLRANGLIPCNLLVKGEAVSFTVKAADVRNLIYTSQVYAVNLNIDGTECKAVIKELQFGPVNEELYHIDFLKFDENEPITVKIPVKLEGHAEGVKAGGKLLVSSRKLKISAMLNELPDTLEVDCSALQIGKQIVAGDLHYEGVNIVSPKATIICSVRPTRASAQAAQNA